MLLLFLFHFREHGENRMKAVLHIRYILRPTLFEVTDTEMFSCYSFISDCLRGIKDFITGVIWPGLSSLKSKFFFKKNYYVVLGVSRFASDKEITKAYHQLSMKYHPDKNGSPEAVSKFHEIKEAYEVLVKSKNAQSYEAVDPKQVEENLRRATEIKKYRKTSRDVLKELEKQNAVMEGFISCVKCKVDILNGGIRFGCGHNSCLFCSETSKVCHRCEKLIRKRQRMFF